MDNLRTEGEKIVQKIISDAKVEIEEEAKKLMSAYNLLERMAKQVKNRSNYLSKQFSKGKITEQNFLKELRALPKIDLETIKESLPKQIEEVYKNSDKITIKTNFETFSVPIKEVAAWVGNSFEEMKDYMIKSIKSAIKNAKEEEDRRYKGLEKLLNGVIEGDYPLMVMYGKGILEIKVTGS